MLSMWTLRLWRSRIERRRERVRQETLSALIFIVWMFVRPGSLLLAATTLPCRHFVQAGPSAAEWLPVLATADLNAHADTGTVDSAVAPFVQPEVRPAMRNEDRLRTQ